MNKVIESRKLKFGLINLSAVLIGTTVEISAQAKVPAEQSDVFSWWNIVMFAMVSSLVAAIYFRYRTKEAEAASANNYKKVAYSSTTRKGGSRERDSDLEWLRTNRKVARKPPVNKGSSVEIGERNGNKDFKINGSSAESLEEFSNTLPIFSFQRLKPTRPFPALSISNDEAVLSAIEQVHDEFEEDEEIRALAVRVLAAFRTSNSVESLTQVALYDLSSGLRSKALTVLSEFDHPSVFESILLGCADPTREVRAAAARALFHLTFNRADAWCRIAESDDEGKMLQSARAAIEGGLVERSFERLAHLDNKYAYEAFALVLLLIKSGETDIIFEFLKKQQSVNVRLAILHTLKVSKDRKALDGLNQLLAQRTLAPELQEEIDKTIEEMGFVTV